MPGRMCGVSVLIEQHPPTVDDRRERRAIGWLTLGLLLAPIGLTVGWYHVLTAPRWSWRDKLVAGLLPVPLVGIPVFGRAGLDAETCQPSDAGAMTCATRPFVGVLEWVVPIALLVLLAWMIRQLSRSARRPVTHPVMSRLAALVLAVVMANTAPALVERIEGLWSHGERNAVIGAAESWRG